MRTLKLKVPPTNAFFATVNVRQLLPASDHCWALGNQIVVHSSDNETVLGSSRKQGGAPNYWLMVAKNVVVGFCFEFESLRVIERRSNFNSWKG